MPGYLLCAQRHLLRIPDGRIVANDVTILFNMEWQAEVRERLTLYFGTILYY